MGREERKSGTRFRHHEAAQWLFATALRLPPWIDPNISVLRPRAREYDSKCPWVRVLVDDVDVDSVGDFRVSRSPAADPAARHLTVNLTLTLASGSRRLCHATTHASWLSTSSRPPSSGCELTSLTNGTSSKDAASGCSGASAPAPHTLSGGGLHDHFHDRYR